MNLGQQDPAQPDSHLSVGGQSKTSSEMASLPAFPVSLGHTALLYSFPVTTVEERGGVPRGWPTWFYQGLYSREWVLDLNQQAIFH